MLQHNLPIQARTFLDTYFMKGLGACAKRAKRDF